MKAKKSKLDLSPSRGSNNKANSSRLNRKLGAPQSFDLRRNIRNILDRSEQQLNVVGRRVESITKRMEVKTIRELKTFEKKLGLAQHWLKDRLEQVRTAELRVESMVDTSKVQAHLGKMDAQDKVAGIKSRYETIRFKLESLREKIAEETIHALESLSGACLDLKHKLESDRSITKGELYVE